MKIGDLFPQRLKKYKKKALFHLIRKRDNNFWENKIQHIKKSYILSIKLVFEF